MCLPPKTTLSDSCGSQIKGQSSLQPCFSISHPLISTHISPHTLSIYNECQLLWTSRDSRPLSFSDSFSQISFILTKTQPNSSDEFSVCTHKLDASAICCMSLTKGILWAYFYSWIRWAVLYNNNLCFCTFFVKLHLFTFFVECFIFGIDSIKHFCSLLNFSFL